MRAVIANALHPSSSRALGGVTLQPHQAEGAARLHTALREFGGALLADEVGLGKTYTALAVARDYAPCTVVAPAVLREMWRSAGRRAGVALTFVSHEQLSRGGQAPPASLVVVDEAHHARNPATRRYATLAHLCAGARVLLLTATPVHNSERDLMALFALFLGERARHLGAPARERMVVRRRADDLQAAHLLPGVAPVEWHALPPAPGVLQALRDIPPPLPVADGGATPALFTLSLVRLWTSSDAAVRAALRRLVARGMAFGDLLVQGRLPTRGEFRAWQADADGVQLAFPFQSSLAPVGVRQLQRCNERHVAAVRHALSVLDASERRASPDASKASRLAAIVAAQSGPVVAFTQFEETARALYGRLRTERGVALCTGRGARMDGHSLPRGVLLRALGVSQRSRARAIGPADADPLLFSEAEIGGGDALTPASLPVRLLVTTDLLSEGVDLQRASHVVHLDLPWTPARLEQRLGRLRRPGGAAACIQISAFTLPEGAESVLALVRTLQRKARAVSRFTGAAELLQGAPWTGAAPGTSGAVATERLWSVISNWRGREGTPATAGTTRVAVVSAPSHGADWLALALVEEDGRHRLLLLTDTSVSDSPSGIMARLEELDGPDAPHGLPAGVVACWEEWAASRRGEALVTLPPGASNRAAQALLRRLQLCAAGAPRQAGRQWSASLSRLRVVLNHARGAHVDRTVETLAAGFRRAPCVAPDDVLRAADRLRRLVRAEGRTTGGAPRLVALLAGVPESPGAIRDRHLAQRGGDSHVRRRTVRGVNRGVVMREEDTMRTMHVLKGVLLALASVTWATSGHTQTKQIPASRLPSVLRAPMAKGTLVRIAPAGNDTVSKAAPSLTIRRGELLAARTGEAPTPLRVGRVAVRPRPPAPTPDTARTTPEGQAVTEADTVYALPFAYIGFGAEGGATPTYRPVYAPQGPLRYSAARDAFEGGFLVGLEDADDPSAERELARSIGVSFGGDADSIAPQTLQFSRTSQDLLRVNIVSRGARDSLGVQIMPRFDPRGVRVWLPVRPALTFEQPPGSLQGFGLESAPLVIGVRGFEPRDSISVTVTAGSGALNTNQVWIGRSGSATVRLRSRGLGPVTLRAVAAGLQPADGATRFAWPVWFAVATLFGAAIGSTISEMRARRASRARQWRRIAAAMLGALVVTAVYVGLGVNLLLQRVEVPLASEIAVFAFAALGALGGATLLAAPRAPAPRGD